MYITQVEKKRRKKKIRVKNLAFVYLGVFLFYSKNFKLILNYVVSH